MSDVNLHLTLNQYRTLLSLLRSVSRVFVLDSEFETSGYPSVPTSAPVSSLDTEYSSINLEPELRVASSVHGVWTTMDLVVSVDTIQLHLYGAGAHVDANVQQHGIARFALVKNTLRYKSMSDRASEAQLILKSFTMCNTEPGNTRFREIIPAAHHNRNQFMVLYSMAGGPNGVSLAVVTIDSPQIIFSISPVLALLDFFTTKAHFDTLAVGEGNYDVKSSKTQNGRGLDFRLDLHDVAICVLENDQDPNTQAIKLNIQQLLVSQQVGFHTIFSAFF